MSRELVSYQLRVARKCPCSLRVYVQVEVPVKSCHIGTEETASDWLFKGAQSRDFELF